jgi:DNA-binding transcriptional regulator YiaG
VARRSGTLGEFGLNLRDWQHEVRDKWRGRRDFARKLATRPDLLGERFEQGDVADGYLAAYALWLADRVGVPRPEWAYEPERIARDPWFASPQRASLLRDAPAHFIERNIFTLPDASFLDRRLRRSRRSGSGNRLLRIREQAGLDQRRFAQRIGVPLGTLRNWEQGRVEPKGAAATLLNLLAKRPGLLVELGMR